MEKKIFKKGDKVYSNLFGWGIVDVDDNVGTYAIEVVFSRGNIESFTIDGKFSISDITPTLSFTEYTLQGFSQERPINWDDCKGKWCIFWDNDSVGRIIRKFEKYENDNCGYYFATDSWGSYQNCKPLSEEMVKELGLDNN